jgi:hypothetical protein
MLIQRIFNDPAFGIQAKVDSILVPQPPRPPLPLADYLDALVTVREKLSALNLLLVECCSHPSMRGMGSEASSAKRLYATKRSYTPFVNDITNNNTVSDINGASSAEIEYDYIKSDYDGEDADEELRSDAEIREFFDEQVIYFIIL